MQRAPATTQRDVSLRDYSLKAVGIERGSLRRMQAENQNRVIVEGDWAVLEYRERVFILVTVAYVPVVFLCLVSFSYWQGDVPDHFGLLAGGLGLLGFVLADILRRRFQCPRCGRPFAKASELHPARCAHCGLKRGTTGPLTSIGPQQ